MFRVKVLLEVELIESIERLRANFTLNFEVRPTDSEIIAQLYSDADP